MSNSPLVDLHPHADLGRALVLYRSQYERPWLVLWPNGTERAHCKDLAEVNFVLVLSTDEYTELSLLVAEPIQFPAWTNWAILGVLVAGVVYWGWTVR